MFTENACSARFFRLDICIYIALSLSYRMARGKKMQLFAMKGRRRAACPASAGRRGTTGERNVEPGSCAASAEPDGEEGSGQAPVQVVRVHRRERLRRLAGPR